MNITHLGTTYQLLSYHNVPHITDAIIDLTFNQHSDYTEIKILGLIKSVCVASAKQEVTAPGHLL